jgi:hypothetical protein
VNDDIRAEFKGTAKNRRCKGVVYNERNVLSVCEIGKALNIQNGERGIRDGLTEEEKRLREMGIDPKN